MSSGKTPEGLRRGVTPFHLHLTKTTLIIVLEIEHCGTRIPQASCYSKNKNKKNFFLFVVKIKITQGKSMDREKGKPRTELCGTLNTFSELIFIGVHIIVD